jgi:transcription initiation factor TFIID TATA-box-binding protein
MLRRRTRATNTDNAAGPVEPAEPVADIVQRLTEKGYPTDIRLSNVVLTCDLDCLIDIRHIASVARNVEYSPKRWSGAIVRIREPKATGMIWKTGRMICLGARTLASARLAVRRLARVVRRCGFDARPRDLRVRNMVASVDARAVLRLEGIVRKHSNVARYEPELFAGLNYQLHRPKVTLVMFVNGKVIFTGAKSEWEIWKAWELLYPVCHGESLPRN